MKIKIAIVDDHVLITEGLVNMLRQHEDLEVSATYSDGTGLLAGLAQQLPDVLLLDIQLPGMLGNELARQVHKQYPDVKIIALSSMDSFFQIKDMLQHGCKGYVTKQAPRDILPEAIRQVYAGEEYLESELRQRWISTLTQSKRQLAQQAPLSEREQEVLALIVAEHTTQEIAERLFLSLRTIESHRYSLLQKLGARNTAGLVRVAVQRGLIE